MKIADAFDFPKDKDALLWYWADYIGAFNKHFVERNPRGVTAEDVHIAWSCLLQRLEELGIPRPDGQPSSFRS
jgi:hypothetical protein